MSNEKKSTVWVCTATIDIETPVVGIFNTEKKAMAFARAFARVHGLDGESFEESCMVEEWEVV